MEPLAIFFGLMFITAALTNIATYYIAFENGKFERDREIRKDETDKKKFENAVMDIVKEVTGKNDGRPKRLR